MDVKKIQRILEQLADVNEQLVSLSDDIWLGIDHRDNESVIEGSKFIQDYNLATSQLSKAAATVEQQLLTYFKNDIESVHSIIEQGDDNEIKNQRMIKELDRSKAYSLNDNFTYKRPYGFVLKGIAYTNITTWKAVYLKVLHVLYEMSPTDFSTLLTDKRFISKRGNPLFTKDLKKLRVAQSLPAGFYTEVNMSANSIKDTLLQILAYFSIDEKEMKIYLREDRDAQLLEEQG